MKYRYLTFKSKWNLSRDSVIWNSRRTIGSCIDLTSDHVCPVSCHMRVRCSPYLFAISLIFFSGTYEFFSTVVARFFPRSCYERSSKNSPRGGRNAWRARIKLLWPKICRFSPRLFRNRGIFDQFVLSRPAKECDRGFHFLLRNQS